MNDDLNKLLKESQPLPKRALRPDFSRHVASLLDKSPPSSWRQWKEGISTMRITKPALFYASLAVIMLIFSGTAYAIVKYTPINNLLYQQPTMNRAEAEEKVKSYYLTYIRDVKEGKNDARDNFLNHTTTELAAKLHKSSTGYDPIMCSQNVPTNVNFVRKNEYGEINARNIFESGSISIDISYDTGTATILDITCPALNDGKAITIMKQFYTDYSVALKNNDPNKMNVFLEHTTKDLRSKLESASGFDPIVCSQNSVAMLDFTNETSNSFDVLNTNYDSTQTIRVTFNPATREFTSITCPTPQ